MDRVLALLVLLTALVPEVMAGSGDLDPAYGSGGFADLSTSVGASYARKEIRQPDGSYVVAGQWGTYDNLLVLFRALPGGLADGSFGGTGVTVVDVPDFFGPAGEHHGRPVGVNLMPDGAITVLVAPTQANDSSQVGHELFMVRLRSDGSLDPTFGGAGVLTIDVGFSWKAGAATPIPGGGFIVVGDDTFFSQTESKIRAMRVLPAGTIDPGFGTNGVAIADVVGAFDEALDVVVDEGGRVIIAGRTRTSLDLSLGSALAVWRLNPDGTTDGSFGSQGVFTHSFGGQSEAQFVLSFPNDTMIVAGRSYLYDASVDRHPGAAFLLRLISSTGNIDPGFGAAGVITPVENDLDWKALRVAPDGKIVAIGQAKLASGVAAAGVARYLPDGSPDETFADHGLARATSYATLSWPGPGFHTEDGAVEPDGAIVVAGSQWGNGGSLLAKFTAESTTCASDADCPLCDSCSPTGVCVWGARQCVTAAAGKATVLIDPAYSSSSSRKKFRFGWKGASPLAFDPVASDDLATCMYVGGRREYRGISPGNTLCGGVPCWRVSAGGYRYADREGLSDGISQVKVSATRIVVQGSGYHLEDPPFALPAPGAVFDAGAITVQVQTKNQCVAATMSQLRRKLVGTLATRVTGHN